jgi:hypothetical protein
VRWIVHGVLFVALAVGIFGVLPRLGGLTTRRLRGVPLGTILVTVAVLAVTCLAGKRSPAGSGHHRG